jgi:hypothetical protein
MPFIKRIGSLVIFLTIISCSVQRVSKVVTKNIELGMSKKEVVSLLGIPYKNAVSKNEEGKLKEVLYYKEQIWTGGRHRLIENKLLFQDERLISIEQGKETDAEQSNVVL